MSGIYFHSVDRPEPVVLVGEQLVRSGARLRLVPAPQPA